MTTRDELIQLIGGLPDENQAELLARLRMRRQTRFLTLSDTGPEADHRAGPLWETVGPAFGAAVLVGFGVSSVGGQAGPLLAVIGAVVGLLTGSVIDRRLASAGP